MRLVVLGAYSLDDLQDMVVQCYSDVPAFPRNTINHQTKSAQQEQQQFSWDSIVPSPLHQARFPFAPSSFKLYRIIPVKDRHNLSITWQLPPQHSTWKTKPCDYIAHLLGHEAQGSLLSSLKKQSWVTTCVAGAGHDGMEVGTYLVGLPNVETISCCLT